MGTGTFLAGMRLLPIIAARQADQRTVMAITCRTNAAGDASIKGGLGATPSPPSSGPT